MDGRGDQQFIVEEGTVVRERQVIINLPKAESMRVNLMVNESLVQYVQPGLAAAIRPVGFGDRVLHGTVEKVNQYAEPTGWRQANVKEYKAYVRIDDPTPDLRAGMTAAVTIRCAEVENALQVPVQAIYAHGPKFYCFVYDNGRWDAREIKPGPTNDKFFVIESGLNEGDRVAMNPRAYLDEVSLPKLSPEEAQRAVPQPATVEKAAEDATKGPPEKTPGGIDAPGGGRQGGPGGPRQRPPGGPRSTGVPNQKPAQGQAKAAQPAATNGAAQ
jgi:HlyD family secretion protein